MRAAARILDANRNRAREALRTMEDVARFALEDAGLTERLRSLRHALREALAVLPEGWLEANRDTAGDVGAMIDRPGEGARRGLSDVAAAAGSRLTEALRVIEEAARMVAPGAAREVESIRYRAYEVEAALHARLLAGRAPQWRVCLLLAEQACLLPWAEVLRAAIEGGADCVQVREPSMSGGVLRRRVEQVLEIARPAGVAVIVNDRPDVAIAAGADGVHVGPDDLSVADVRRIAGAALLVGASTHDLDEATAAVAAGADYCGVGAMFATETKPDRPPSGPEYLREYLRIFPRVPHLAIGGISPANVGRLAGAGAAGVAVCGAVCRAERPAEVVRALRRALERAGNRPGPA